MGGAAARQRYWARSHVGWRHVARAAPNAGHRAVAELERLGLVTGIITQNVDGLHQAAGARQVIELHGSLDRVLCLRCRQRSGRGELDGRLRAANPGWLRYAGGAVTGINPDGDAVLGDASIERFQVVDCLRCGGCSNRTWCSSARTCRGPGWPTVTRWSRRPGRWSCWVPR